MSIQFLRSIWILVLCSGIYLNSCNKADEIQKGGYVSGDFHQHTTYSGGDFSIGHVMEASDKYGLDWWSISDHGGTREFWGKALGDDIGARVTWKCSGVRLLGSPQKSGNEGFMWRWQSLKYYNFQDILIWRRVFPGKLILQAFEWNVPGHEHANVFNNIAPDVCFGFDGMPGHQKNNTRGSYELDEGYNLTDAVEQGGAAFGGAGVFIKI